jgi:hypothetical protein
VLQHLDESLSHNAGGAQNTNRNFAVHMVTIRILGIL